MGWGSDQLRRQGLRLTLQESALKAREPHNVRPGCQHQILTLGPLWQQPRTHHFPRPGGRSCGRRPGCGIRSWRSASHSRACSRLDRLQRKANVQSLQNGLKSIAAYRYCGPLSNLGKVQAALTLWISKEGNSVTWRNDGGKMLETCLTVR